MKKKTKKRSKTSDLVFSTFVGEYVRLSSNRDEIVHAVTEDTQASQTVPRTYEGFLLDMDEKFYFLGVGADSVVAAVKKSIVEVIEVVDKRSPYDEILDKIKPIGMTN